MSNDVQNSSFHLSHFIRSLLLDKQNCNYIWSVQILFPHAPTDAQDNLSFKCCGTDSVLFAASKFLLFSVKNIVSVRI